ncbi:MAG: hypothetical protein QOE19_686 [Actinomycetota bacterium]|jgi:hypothetical protein|nr:hypothetical protein [Actinomycetota bacterium]MDQ1664363.1 hypothetical protein [Actinomycetota bacterium]
MTVVLAVAADNGDAAPGLLGFVVVAALGVATWLLLRSMRRQMRKIDLPDPPREKVAEDDAEPSNGPGPTPGPRDGRPPDG